MPVATSIVILSTGLHGPGTVTFAATSVPTGIIGLTIGMSRSAFTLAPSLSIDWSIELSQDNGSTWLAAGGAGTKGGDVIDPDTLNVVARSSFTVGLPQSTNPNRKLRGQITFSDSVITDLTVDFLN